MCSCFMRVLGTQMWPVLNTWRFRLKNEIWWKACNKISIHRYQYKAHYFQSYWYDYYDLRSSRPKLISPEVMSPEILSQVPRNAELCGSKFYHAQKHPSILTTHLSPLFHCSTRVKERDILHISTPTFVSSLLKERGMLHLHSARFVSWYHGK